MFQGYLLEVLDFLRIEPTESRITKTGNVLENKKVNPKSVKLGKTESL